MSEKQHCIELLMEATPYIRSEFGVRSMGMFGSVARVARKTAKAMSI